MSILETVFCSLTSAVLAGLLVGWRAYYWGLRSQRESAKHEARCAVLASIDSARVAVEAAYYLKDILLSSRAELEPRVFDFASRVSRRSQDRIHNAWKPYGALTEYQVSPDYHRSNRTGDPALDRPAEDAARMRETMLQPLRRLRDEIENA